MSEYKCLYTEKADTLLPGPLDFFWMMRHKLLHMTGPGFISWLIEESITKKQCQLVEVIHKEHT